MVENHDLEFETPDTLVTVFVVLSPTSDLFLTLLRAGLWEQSVRLLPFEPVDFGALYELTEQQSVVGLIAAGLGHVEDRKVTKPEALPFLKKVYSLESRNQGINSFIEELYGKMNAAGIQSVLVKGQGIGQCYERPLWRAPGDVDLLLDAENYEKAKSFLSPLASSVDKEMDESKHLGMKFDPWKLELHGTLHGHISKEADAVVDRVQDEMYTSGHFRVWKNGETDVLLPAPDSDVIFVFSHIQQHFFRGGIGLRQICDWVRLLWTYRESIDRGLLERRIREMKMMTEWKAFAAFAVDFLGMPAEVMPLYDPVARWKRKASRISAFILRVGNFGHNRDGSIYTKYPYVVYKAISLGRHIGDFFEHLFIFPLDSLRVFGRMITGGVKAVARGE